MADEEQLNLLRQSVVDWNAWRSRHFAQQIQTKINFTGAHLRGADLSGANLRGADLIEADLRGANLSGADLTRAELREAELTGADLFGADLTEAELTGAGLTAANLTGANLTGADLTGANLTGAILFGAHLRGADLRGAFLQETALANLDLSNCKGLENCRHFGPSSLDIRTLRRSGPLPLAFLRGVGLPDKLIDYLPSLLDQAIRMYSCFISYSSRDEDFARRLHADLQDKGVRCWFAPHDMPIGAKILDTIDEAIRLRDKVLLVLSEASIASEWVEDEVTKAFAEERSRGITVLFPIRLDAAVRNTNEAWARKLWDSRNIGDFSRWKDHDAYKKALDRLLRDLRIETA